MQREQQQAVFQNGNKSHAEVAGDDAELGAAASALIAEYLAAQVAAALPHVSRATRTAVVNALAAGGVSDGVALAAAASREHRAAETELVDNLGALSALAQQAASLAAAPVRDNPALVAVYEQGRLHTLADLAGLQPVQARKVVAAAASLANVGDDLLADMVTRGDLTAAQATTFGRAVTLYHLLGGNTTLVQAAQQRLGAAEASALARLDAAGWKAMIAAGHAAPPAGMTVDAWADQLVASVGAVYPTDALLGRLVHAGSRIGIDGQLLARLHDENPGVDFLKLDYSTGGANLARLRLEGASAAQRTHAFDAWKTIQRTYAVASDPARTMQLLAAGYRSALDMFADGEVTFRKKTGLDETAAKIMFSAASDVASQVAARVGTIVDIVKGGFGDLRPHNINPDVADYLKQIDGFTTLFGSQAMCKCSECESIIGPSAYFVDLMCFVAQHVTNVYFTGSHAKHPLALKQRRPDLWTLELTCENCDTLIPTLDIVDEILENYIANGHASLADRSAVEDYVYRQTLPGPEHSLAQPFHLPLLRLDTYLGALGQTRVSLAQAAGAAAGDIVAARLGVSPRQRELIDGPNTQLAFLSQLYGIAFQVNGAELATIEAKLVYGAMELDRAAFGTLTDTRFVRSGAQQLAIVTEKSTPEAVQPDIERVHHLTLDALDRMHRMTRLQRRLPWTIGELDLVLSHLGDPALKQLGAIVDLLLIQDQLGAPVEELCALTGAIPQLPAETDSTDLFARLFNTSYYLTAAGTTYPQDAVRFVHPSFRSAAPASTDTTLARLLGGLRVSDEDLIRLITALAPPLMAALDDANEDLRGFFLSVENLSLLYRHARLAERLALTIGELFQLIALAGLGDHVATAAHVTQLLDFRTWWKSTSYSLDDLGFITGGPVAVPELFADPAAVAKEILDAVANDKSLLLADTVFAYFAGVTETQSRAIFMVNPTLFELAPDGKSYWLAAAFTPASAITIPAALPVDAAAVLELLVQHHASRIVPSRLASKLSMDLARVTALLAMSGIDLGTGYTRALQGTDAIDPLVAAVRAILPLAELFADELWNPEALSFIQARAALFGVATFTAVTVSAVRKLSVYATFARTDAALFIGSAQPRDPEDVRAVLGAFTQGQKFGAADPARLARVLRAEAGLVSTVAAAVTLPDTAPEALDMLSRCTGLVQALGVSGDFLQLAVSVQYVDLQKAADAALSAFRARSSDETEWANKVEPFDDKIREGKRSALVDYLVRTLDPGFADADAIYKYFLIDPQLCGCARTSRVVSATSSVQLYVNRVLMNLEQDALAANAPGHVAVPPTAIPTDEWLWRKNYRVWQANRKVFLWPENYIEPELRDDKSPLFEDLEGELLQQAIDDDSVLDAYGTYLRGFDDVAELKIVGAWHDVRYDLKQDVLHLIGAAPGDPPLYYYRSAENLLHAERDGDGGVVWSPWKRIEVQITARRAQPVVHNGRLYLFWAAYTTKSRNSVSSGSSNWDGYNHTMAVKFSTLRADGKWTPPQQVELPGGDVPGQVPFGPGAGQIRDMLIKPHAAGVGIPEHSHATTAQSEARDDYTLRGDNWDRLYLDPADEYKSGALTLCGRDYLLYGTIDLYHRSLRSYYQDYINADSLGVSPLLCAKTTAGVRKLYYGSPNMYRANRFAYADMVLDEARIKAWELASNIHDHITPTYTKAIADIGDVDLMSIGGTLDDIVVQKNGDALLVMGSARQGKHWLLRRIGTTLSDKLGEKLFTDGLDEMLDVHYQLNQLKEATLPITITNASLQNGGNAGKLDFKGAYGVYYREIFFHIPFLIANYLNSQGKYESAQSWYQYIFDPTAAETTTPERDRNWRYAEFRGLSVPKLVDMLTDADALEIYRTDPFNPHAIARVRLSAYQKCIVMKYIDNLLDWGDSLFTQFTTESLGEATMLYVMAQDILGPRPEQLGDCTDRTAPPRTYADLESQCKPDNDFLISVETYGAGKRFSLVAEAQPSTYVLTQGMVDQRARANRAPAPIEGRPQSMYRAVWQAAATPASRSQLRASAQAAPSFGYSFVRQVSSAFCIPRNEDLMAYWDRVEDRLYKIRNCMDIDGVRRLPALFAPPIDPAMLVRMKAMGLSLDDVLSSMGGDLPPYRFLYLIEKAKQYAGALQGFGSQLLAALEKKDAEDLAQLRTVHQENILKMSTRVRQQEIDTAQTAVDSLQAQIDTVTWRRDYHQGLIDDGLNGPEIAQQVSRHMASTVYAGEALTLGVAAVLALVPQAGSPFAMKWGGLELHGSSGRFAGVARATAMGAEAVASSAALEATFQRRSEGWSYLRDLATKELKSLNKQYDAATIRLEMANRAMEIHETSIDQTQEVYDFFRDKFSNLGLYTYLSTTLQREFRDAYNGAFAMAKLAEQAYRFERNDDKTSLLRPSYWDATHNGLLTGEQLVLDLQAMERHFLETNYRSLEVDQSFSLQQLDPAALVQLRQTGECDVSIPELYFDLFYPGHYLRRIKSVRLTIPSVTGPYTNVSATLTLTGSKIRTKPDLAAASLVDVPPRRSVSIATSSAQNDAGVFELSFRDERYMPFEGAGAISTWRLSLPKNLRPFDYQTINDIILSVAYTAESSGTLRDQVDATTAAVAGNILDVLGKQTSARVFSLRQDFSATFSRLLHSPAGTAVPFEITDKFLPLFLAGRTINVTSAKLVARPAPKQALGAFAVTIDGKPASAFAADATFGGLPSVDLGTVFTGKLLGVHSIAVTSPGGLAPTPLPPGDVSAVDAAKLADLFIYVAFRVT